MKLQIHSILTLAAGTVIAMPAPLLASTLSVRLTLPEITTQDGREPRRPYVALWVRKAADHEFGTNLAVWYAVEEHHGRRGPGAGVPGGEHPPGEQAPGDSSPWARGSGPGARPHDPGALEPVRSENTPGGARWMNGVREWWADSGHTLKFPVDGLTSASRPAGTYELSFASTEPALASLPPGDYLLMVEAAREHGGDETLSIPFTWPARAAQSGKAAGHAELGAVELTLKP